MRIADLRGFELRTPLLRQLVRNNSSTLHNVTLPAGLADDQLEMLLETVQFLRQLTVGVPADTTGRWLRLLPQSLYKLEIIGMWCDRSILILPMLPHE